MLLDIAAVLSKSNMESFGRGKGVSRTPGDLLSWYMDNIPLLPATADQWGFHLPLIFFKHFH